jgi:four helix bundle protein
VKKVVEHFEDLIIWQKAVEFAKEIYLVTENGAFRTDHALKNQMRDASVSISSNIAEGFERRSRKEYLNFLNIAKASAGKAGSQLFVAREVGYLSEEEHQRLREMARFLSGSIANHMTSIRHSESNSRS